MVKKLLSLVVALAMLLTSAAALAESTLLVDAPVTVSVVCDYDAWCMHDRNEKPAYKKMAEETGITFHIEEINDFDSQIQLMIAGDELPDLIMGTVKSISSNLDYFMELTDLINQYAPSLVKLFEEEPSVKASVTQADGGIYQLPIQSTWMVDSAMGGFMWINQTWLDNVGMKNPTNLDELYAVLCAFRDQDANGNGDPNDEVPFGFSELNWAGKLDDIFGSFGILSNYWSGYTQITDDHKVIFQPAQTEYYNALCWLHKLYSEGLLDPEGFSQTSDQYYARTAQDVYGITYQYNPQSSVASFVPLNPILGENGTLVLDGNKNLSSASGTISISAKSENAVAILKAYEYMNSDIARKVTNRFGEEGVSWEFANDQGDWILQDSSKPGPEGYETWDQYIYDIGETGRSGLAFFSMSDWKHNVSPLTVRETAITSYLPYMLNNYYKYMGLEESLANEQSLLWTEILAYIQGFHVDAIVNGIDEAGWQKHMDTLNTLQIDRYVELKQMAYDAFLNTLK